MPDPTYLTRFDAKKKQLYFETCLSQKISASSPASTYGTQINIKCNNNEQIKTGNNTVTKVPRLVPLWTSAAAVMVRQRQKQHNQAALLTTPAALNCLSSTPPHPEK